MVTQAAPGERAREFLLNNKERPEEREKMLRFLGSKVAELHDLGLHHAHLTTRHLFVTDDFRLTLIDMESSFILRPLPMKFRGNNLRQIHESFKKYLPDFNEVSIFQESYLEKAAKSSPEIVDPAKKIFGELALL